MYFGTYTKGVDSKGIYLSAFDSDAGTLGKPALAGELENPSFLTITPSGKYLYAVTEIGSGSGGGIVTAFRIGERESWEKINAVDSGGACLVTFRRRAMGVSLPWPTTEAGASPAINSVGRHHLRARHSDPAHGKQHPSQKSEGTSCPLRPFFTG